MSEAYLIKC